MLIPKTYPILKQVVEEGVTYGYRRAHKYTEEPTEKEITSAITDGVMNHIDTFFRFSELDKLEL